MSAGLIRVLFGLLVPALLAVGICAPPSNAAGGRGLAFDLYVIAVGSSYFAVPPANDGSHGMTTISGANRSARELASRFAAGGARFTLLLTSDPRGLIAPGDVDAALATVEARIAKDKPGNPLILLYIASHGVSEGVGWNHFSVPGTFLYPGKLSELDIGSLSAATLYAGNLADRLDHSGARYVLILDSCYEGQAADFDSPILSGPAIESLKSVADVIRVVNEFRQANPVLYSTPPGTLAKTVDDPYQPNATPVAPLARRLMLILDRQAAAKSTLTLGDLVGDLTSPTLDSATKPAVTNAVRDKAWSSQLLSFAFSAGHTEGQLEKRTGSAKAGTVCCIRDASAEVADTPVTMRGIVDIAGAAGEFITDGRSLHFNGNLAVTREKRQALTFSFEADGESWEISLSAREKEDLSAGEYSPATRYPFAAENEASMSITGAGRACNESTGRFTIRQIKFGASGDFLSIDAIFRQFCDGSKLPLEGALVVK